MTSQPMPKVIMRRVVRVLGDEDGWEPRPGCLSVGLECGHARDDVLPAEAVNGRARCPKCEGRIP